MTTVPGDIIDDDVLLGNGDGSFGAPSRHRSSSSIRSSAAVAVADFNGDGKLDFATACGTVFGSDVTVALGTGTGTFGPAVVLHRRILSPVRGRGRRERRRQGRPGDGEHTATTSASCWAPARVLRGRPELRRRLATSVAMADFNGDGKIDLVTANAGSVSVLLGTGTGSFSPPVYGAAARTRSGWLSAISTATAVPDVAWADYSANNVSVAAQQE